MRHFAPLLFIIALAGNGEAAATPAQPAVSARATDNRAIITDFARLFYTQKDVRKAFETYVAPDYIQHNPGIADGRDAAIARLTPMFSDPDHSYVIRRILVDGDFAAIHLWARPSPDARGAAVADFYRLKDGKIVEHWDVIQPIPEKAANSHPMF